MLVNVIHIILDNIYHEMRNVLGILTINNYDMIMICNLDHFKVICLDILIRGKLLMPMTIKAIKCGRKIDVQNYSRI